MVMFLLYPILPPVIQAQQPWLASLFGAFTHDKNFEESFFSAHPANKTRFFALGRHLAAGGDAGCFAGAGISYDYGMPLWNKFLADACTRFPPSQDLIEAFQSPDLPAQAQALANADAGLFETIICEAFSHKRIKPELVGPAPILPFLPFRYMVTTNFDMVLETVYQLSGYSLRPVIYGGDISFAAAAQAEGLLPLLKIHGDYLGSGQRILTTSQYNDFYVKGKPLPQQLVKLFSTMPFLFVGYSLSDREVCDALLEAREKEGSPAHYVILKAWSPEYAATHDEEYTRLGVQPIWFTGGFEVVPRILGMLAGLLKETPDLFTIGLALRFDAGYEDALPVCRECLRKVPQSHALKMAYATCLANGIDLLKIYGADYVQKMVAQVDRAIGSVDSFPEAYSIRALLNTYRFLPGEVIEDATTAIEQGALGKEYMYMLRGQYRFLYMTDYENARNDFLSAIQLLPEGDQQVVPFLKLYLAAIALREGNPVAFRQAYALLKEPALAAKDMKLVRNVIKLVAGVAMRLKMEKPLAWLCKSNRLSRWMAKRSAGFVSRSGKAGLLQPMLKKAMK